MSEICTFLRWREEESDLWKWKMALLGQLTNKDYRDCKASVLQSHMEVVLPLKKGLPDDIFTECVLNPRIDIETMTAYAAFIQNYFTEEKKEELSSDAEKIITYVEEQIVSRPQKEYGALLTTPVGCLRSGVGSARSKKVLLVALCRSLGIPARLNPVNKVPEIWQGNGFVPVKADKTPNSAILIREDGKTVWNYNQNWSVSSFQDGAFVPLSPIEENIKAHRIPAVPGIYRLVTCNRLAGGSQLVRKMDFVLKDGEEKEAELSLPEADASRMLKDIQLPGFELYGEDGQKVKASEMERPVTGNLMFWLEESREPTEHILNEIYEQAESFEPYQKQMYFIIRSEEAKTDLNISRVLGRLPEIQIMYDTAGENVRTLGLKAGVDPDKLPLILVIREELQCVFAASGYNVGTADMLLRILKMGNK